MSRIAAVDPIIVAKPGAGPGGRDEALFLVRIVTEDGTIGYGEAHGAPHMLRAVVDAPVTHASAAGLRALLLGQAVADVPALWRRLYAGTKWVGRDGVVLQAIAACDIALWDIAARRRGEPLAATLAASFPGTLAPRRRIATYASGKVGPTPEATARRVAADVAAGFSTVKIGWPPFGAALDADLAFLEAARDAAGPDVALAVDAAQAWTPHDAAARVEAFARFDLAFLEEPLDRDDVEGSAHLARSAPMTIAGGEGECSPAGLRRLIAARAVGLLQPDVTRAGITAVMEIAGEAAAAGLTIASHSFTSALNVAAHLHVLAVLPNAVLAEWPSAPLALWADAIEGDLGRPAPDVAVPDGPGLGLRPRIA